MGILILIDGTACTKRMFDYLIEHPDTIGKADDFTLMFVCAPIPLRVAMGMDDDATARFCAEEARHASEAATRRFEFSVPGTQFPLWCCGFPWVRRFEKIFARSESFERITAFAFKAGGAAGQDSVVFSAPHGRAERTALADCIRAMTPKRLADNSTDMIRADRDLQHAEPRRNGLLEGAARRRS